MSLYWVVDFLLFKRGQPITTSAGKWLQLMLTISDVVDLSRFRFDLTYRVVRADIGNLSPSSSAVAVSGVGNNGSGAILWYGDPVPGTLCSRNLHSCDQRTCILQTPNFPGLYPRYCTDRPIDRLFQLVHFLIYFLFYFSLFTFVLYLISLFLSLIIIQELLRYYWRH